MDKYYICRVYNGEFFRIKDVDNYYDAVIEAAVYSKKNRWTVVVVHGADVVYKVKP